MSVNKKNKKSFHNYVAVIDIEKYDPSRSSDNLYKLWKELITGFISKKCTGFGFDTIVKKEDIKKIQCFKDWQPEYISQVETEIILETKYGDVSDKKVFSLFRFEEEVRYRLLYAAFSEWNSADPDYSADELYFYEHDRLILLTVPHEIIIMLCNLNVSEINLLKSIDNKITECLSQTFKRYIYSEIF